MSIDREFAQIQVRYRVASGFWPPEEIAETVLEECFDPAQVTSDDEAGQTADRADVCRAARG